MDFDSEFSSVNSIPFLKPKARKAADLIHNTQHLGSHSSDSPGLPDADHSMQSFLLLWGRL